MKKLICVETDKYTKFNDNVEDYEIDDVIDAAANRLIRREPEFDKDDFVCVRSDKLRSEICRHCGDMTEHSGEYRTFKISE